jgi:F0F1-type ATP synthase assembly protein I
MIAVVAAVQAVIVAAIAALAWWWSGAEMAKSIAAGGGCAWAGTLAYAVGQALVPGRSASRLLWSHLTGEVAKIAVALGLLLWGLSADRSFAPGAFLAGFIVALLAYPLEMPLLKSK